LLAPCGRNHDRLHDLGTRCGAIGRVDILSEQGMYCLSLH
jgi:hypothetical protein